jgi:hypothetical protein
VAAAVTTCSEVAVLLQHPADVVDGLGDVALEALHVPPGHRDQPHGRPGRDRRGAQVGREQPDLAEEVARAQIGDMLAPPGDLGLALLDGHELIGELSLLDQRLAAWDLALLGERSDRRKLVVGDLCEQRDRF